jgi:hypothetical protein
MDMWTIVLAAIAAVFGGLYLNRRRSRLRSDQYE